MKIIASKWLDVHKGDETTVDIRGHSAAGIVANDNFALRVTP